MQSAMVYVAGVLYFKGCKDTRICYDSPARWI